MKWTKVDHETGEPAKRTGNSFYPHDYVSDGELGLRIENRSFVLRRGGWVLTTKKHTPIRAFDTLKAAKAYAETLE